MKKRQDKRQSSAGRLHDPFAGLAALRDALPAAAPVAAAGRSPRGPARAVVRLERKGRGGKEATVVDGLELPAASLEEWVTALKASLGCGGKVEEGKLVLQGDQRPRLGVLLEQRGVRRVVMG